MDHFRCEPSPDGSRLRLLGELGICTATAAWRTLCDQLNARPQARLALDELDTIDTAGLQLLFALHRRWPHALDEESARTVALARLLQAWSVDSPPWAGA